MTKQAQMPMAEQRTRIEQALGGTITIIHEPKKKEYRDTPYSTDMVKEDRHLCTIFYPRSNGWSDCSISKTWASEQEGAMDALYRDMFQQGRLDQWYHFHDTEEDHRLSHFFCMRKSGNAVVQLVDRKTGNTVGDSRIVGPEELVHIL